MRVRELEAALFRAFPPEHAEPWDHVGLSVGDPDEDVTRVLVALDAAAREVREAHARGANVLLTHHPVYIKAPEAFVPRAGERPQAAEAVFAAARDGVSILSFHTDLDRSREAQRLLPSLMGLEALHSLEHPLDRESCGLGSVADLPEPCTLCDLAREAATAFSTAPRVWGKRGALVRRAAFLGGSLGDLGEAARSAGAQAVICGEAGYHVCQDLAARGLGVILLGHDASEYPFTRILARAAERAGIAPDDIVISEPPRQWWTVSKGDCS